MTLSGILVLNKPSGWTSHDCVAKVRKLAKTKKVGHTGTLDPDVTGVLPICIGKATKVVQFLINDQKKYKAQITLGQATTTEDQSGEILEDQPILQPPTHAQILHTLNEFLGEVEQVPPMYSAVKIKGKKLYQWAHEGKVIPREPRTITIYDMHLLEYIPTSPYPIFCLDVSCSKGTYIRTLAVDIGKNLGYPAHLSSLVRTESGAYTLADSITMDALEQWGEDEWSTNLKPIDTALEQFPQLVLDDDLIQRIKYGQTVPVEHCKLADGSYRIYDQQHQFIALYQTTGSEYIKPIKIFEQ